MRRIGGALENCKPLTIVMLSARQLQVNLDMPAEVKSIKTLMKRIGTVMDLAEVIEHEDGPAWTLRIDENLSVLAEYDAHLDRIILSIETATPPADRLLQTYEILLLFNAQWRSTGGVRLVLEAPDAPVVQVAEIAPDALDLSGLATVIMALAAKAIAWRRLIADGAGLDRSGGEGALGNSPKPSRDAVRV